jgi:drug/metabolite transporter (DMT)-like permease
VKKRCFYQLVVSAPLLGGAPSAVALGAFAYKTVWVVSITFTIWFVLIVRYSAARLSVFTFLTPLFGVAADHVVLNQPLTPAFALAVSAGGRRAPSRQHAPVTLYAYRGLARRSCGGPVCAL